MFRATISTLEVARALRISEAGVLDLMKEKNVNIVDGGISVRQAAEFMQQVEQDESLRKKRAAEHLVRVVHRFTIIVDTCTLLNDSFHDLYRRLSPLLAAEGNKLVIPTSVMAELKHLLLTRPDLRSKIAAIFAFLEEESDAGLIEFKGDENDVFGDQQILALASKLFLDRDVMLLTSDNNLSRDALKLNQLDSVRGREVCVSRVNKFGFISKYLPQVHEPDRRFGADTVLAM